MKRLKVITLVLTITLLFAAPAAAQATFDQAEPGEVRLAVGPANVEAEAGFFAENNISEAAVSGVLAEAEDESPFFEEDLFSVGFPF